MLSLFKKIAEIVANYFLPEDPPLLEQIVIQYHDERKPLVYDITSAYEYDNKVVNPEDNYKIEQQV